MAWTETDAQRAAELAAFLSDARYCSADGTPISGRQAIVLNRCFAWFGTLAAAIRAEAKAPKADE